VKANGHEYKKGDGIIMKMECDLPQVGHVSNIYVVNKDRVVFTVDPYSSSFLPHFHVYVLHRTSVSSQQFVHMSDLVVKSPVLIRTPKSLPHSKVIILPHYVHCVD